MQQLELAALVCAQAMARDPRYAPIHDTAALVEHELGRMNGAITELARAVELDPKFFEAQMNYAAANLGIRGFERAQTAYRSAIAIRPNDYDAHLGLAVALRGVIGDEPVPAAFGAKIDAVSKELDTAKQIDDRRPEAFFNEGLLAYDIEMKRTKTPEERTAVLDRAKASLRSFLVRAHGKAGYEDAIARASERLGDIASTRLFLRLPPAAPAGAIAGAARCSVIGTSRRARLRLLTASAGSPRRARCRSAATPRRAGRG